MNKNNKIYFFNKEEFLKAYRLSGELYSLSVILFEFSKLLSEEKQAVCIIPLVEHIKNQADKLCMIFADCDINNIE